MTRLANNSFTDGRIPPSADSGFDLYVRNPKNGPWKFADNVTATSVDHLSEVTPEYPGTTQYRFYLPLFNEVASLKIAVLEGDKIGMPESDPENGRKPIVVYGTSITQGMQASRPGLACTAIVGRKLGMPTINLGFAGYGNMEMPMADLLGELDASVYVLDSLRNTGPQLIEERVIPFIERLRAFRPDTPIVIPEDAHYRNAVPTKCGLAMRAVFDRMTEKQKHNLVFVSAKDMIGDDGEGVVDQVHLNDLGMMRQADVFVNVIAPLIKPSK